MKYTQDLHTGFSFYFMRRSKNGKPMEESDRALVAVDGTKAEAFTDAVKLIGTVGTIEEFWSIYNHMRRPDDLPATTDYHFFREGIQPTWEDPQNAHGGKWTLRLPKKGILASRLWEEIILALIGGQFSGAGVPDGEVCGAVMSVRERMNVLAIWTKSSKNQTMINKVGASIKRILSLPSSAFSIMYYQIHPRPES
jgi:translation initiation factor 4E